MSLSSPPQRVEIEAMARAGRGTKRVQSVMDDALACKTCGKVFTTKGNLKKHVQTVHLGKKNFKCDTCGKAFGEAGNLNRHVQTIHLGQKNFTCDTCGKSFGLAHNLKAHVQTIHLGQRPKRHKCDECDQAFAYKRQLDKHLETQHAEALLLNLSRQEEAQAREDAVVTID